MQRQQWSKAQQADKAGKILNPKIQTSQAQEQRELKHKGNKDNLSQTGGKRWDLETHVNMAQVKLIRQSQRWGKNRKQNQHQAQEMQEKIQIMTAW